MTEQFCFHLYRKEGIEVRVVKRGEYDEGTVRWADAIISAGGKIPSILSTFMCMKLYLIDLLLFF